MLNGGAGDDTLTYAGATGPVIVDLGGVTAGETDDASDFETVTGTAAGDTLIGDGDANTLNGGGGATP